MGAMAGWARSSPTVTSEVNCIPLGGSSWRPAFHTRGAVGTVGGAIGEVSGGMPTGCRGGSTSQWRGLVCYHCGRMGHLQRDCPVPIKGKRGAPFKGSFADVVQGRSAADTGRLEGVPRGWPNPSQAPHGIEWLQLCLWLLLVEGSLNPEVIKLLLNARWDMEGWWEVHWVHNKGLLAIGRSAEAAKVMEEAGYLMDNGVILQVQCCGLVRGTYPNRPETEIRLVLLGVPHPL